MEEGIQAQLDGGDAADPEFLAAVLKRLTLAKAKARLREIHEDLLRKHLDRIVAAPDRAEDVAAAMGWADEDKVSDCNQFFLGLECSKAGTIVALHVTARQRYLRYDVRPSFMGVHLDPTQGWTRL